MKSHGDIDSKFRFVIIAAKRAKLLLTGAKPKIRSKSKNPIRIAQNEVAQGLIGYEIIQPKEEKTAKPEEDFIGEEIEEKVKEGEKKEITEIKNNSKGKAGDKLKKKTKKKAKEKKK